MAKYTDSIDNPLITAIIAHAVNAGIGIAAEAGLLSATSVNTWTVAVIPIVTMVIAGAIAFFHGHNAQKSWGAMQQSLASRPVLQPNPSASRVNPMLAEGPDPSLPGADPGQVPSTGAEPPPGLSPADVVGGHPDASTHPSLRWGTTLGGPPQASPAGAPSGVAGPQVRPGQ